MITYLGTDIVAQKAYFQSIQEADDHLETFLFEAGEGTDVLVEASRTTGFSYPALILFMPNILLSDTAHGLIQATQDNSFAVLCLPADSTAHALSESISQAQSAVFRIIRQMRKDVRAGRYNWEDSRHWKIRPMTQVGPDRACGMMVDFKIITNANALVGSSD
ncbi:hypothetical protein GCM10028803_53230 [Larkinella knui]|uniref:Uncharacterized protein n=1 Tax=Larkinella knui TaxID=2025310 RepID=A0A3P1CGK0_9BACT|nr:hypothetical protein [Larkinella knui]RRB12471.1 hypothetical protein EHT87_19930 [Larkinella knui]